MRTRYHLLKLVYSWYLWTVPIVVVWYQLRVTIVITASVQISHIEAEIGAAKVTEFQTEMENILKET